MVGAEEALQQGVGDVLTPLRVKLYTEQHVTQRVETVQLTQLRRQHTHTKTQFEHVSKEKEEEVEQEQEEEDR